jgi:hypothetical protein
MPDDADLKTDLRSALQARGELGQEMEPEVVEAFVARIEKRLGEGARQQQWALESKRNHQKEMVLGSMAIAIPMLAVAAVFTGLAGVIAVCLALVVIAVVSTRS